MSTPLHEKIRQIRETETSGRTDFEKKTGISRRTVENLENQGREPKGTMLTKICEIWPEYTMWLMTDTYNIDHGQLTPAIKKQGLELAKPQKAG